MPIEIKIPSVGESITEVEIGEWLKKPGDSVSKNENLLVIETDKATVEVPAPASGTLARILKQSGESAAIGEVVGSLEAKSNGAPVPARENDSDGKPEKEPAQASLDREPEQSAETAGSTIATPPTPPPDAEEPIEEPTPDEGPSERAVEIIAAKEMTAQQTQDAEPPDTDRWARSDEDPGAVSSHEADAAKAAPEEKTGDQVVPMSLLRRRIAERLVAAQQTAAMLTTFNEIDMSAVIALRKAEGETFRARHQIKLGFMSFFIKAVVTALQSVREINAEIRGDNIVYHNYCDIGVAVGGGKGLVVPVLRHAERMTFAAIERAIDAFAKRARENRLTPDELRGGTFTITNGGVYGSLLSTPIINPPQSAILGLHAIQDRPVARNREITVRPMMYAALTYDHRLIDGREAVVFLKQVKSMIEEPARMLLEF